MTRMIACWFVVGVICLSAAVPWGVTGYGPALRWEQAERFWFVSLFFYRYLGRAVTGDTLRLPPHAVILPACVKA
jgi:hypothetical protein